MQRAARELGESPTKAQYEDLGVTPASATIIRVMGGWNEAKSRAGLETVDRAETGGTGVQPRPDDVEIPDGERWEELTGQQRWYYKNRAERIARKDRRRAELRRWLYEFKLHSCECARCDEDRPPCLDFHHTGEKAGSISKLITDGYSKADIRAEIERCTVLCANCHRVEHYDPPSPNRPSP